jgi:hypothetical protein
MWEKRVAPLSGALFAALLVAALLVDANTEFMPSESEVVTHIQDGPVRVMIAAYLSLLAAAALVWFSGSSYKFLRRTDDDGGRLSVIALGGGIFASAMLAMGAVAMTAVAERVRTTGTIEPGVAAALFDINGVALGNAAPMGMALLIGVWGVAILRGQDRSSAIGWISVLIALGLLSPFSWAVVAAAVVWIPAAGIWLYRSSPASTPVGVA